MNRSWYLATSSSTKSTDTPLLEFCASSSLTCANYTRNPVYYCTAIQTFITELKSNFKFMKYENKNTWIWHLWCFQHCLENTLRRVWWDRFTDVFKIRLLIKMHSYLFDHDAAKRDTLSFWKMWSISQLSRKYTFLCFCEYLCIQTQAPKIQENKLRVINHRSFLIMSFFSQHQKK